MPSSVYLETSLISYLTSPQSGIVIRAARQELTRRWWRTCRREYELYVSEAVAAEVARGNMAAARLRLEAIADLPRLQATAEVATLARHLVRVMQLPPKAELDALHVALAAVHELDLLLTWNCAHIANALLRNPLTAACTRLGYRLPNICTPDQLMEGALP